MANCNEDGCQVSSTGICVNGLSLDECPHYTEDEIIDSDESGSPDNKSEIIAIEEVEVHDGKALKLNDVNRISTKSVTRLVILAGMPDAGKTTILLSLIHMFCTNSNFENYLFAGSETLIDFEQKGHSAKIDSGNADEKTARTVVGTTTFLHLRVANMKNSQQTDLLFTDISGEDFRNLKDSTEECRKFTIGNRADHFSLFFDTKRLVSLKDRANAKQGGLALLRSLLEAETLLPHTRIQIIFSRWDYKGSDGGHESENEFIEGIKSQVLALVDARYKVEFFTIAARPRNNDLPFGYGIDKIFPIWVEGSLLDRSSELKFKTLISNENRQYLQFTFND